MTQTPPNEKNCKITLYIDTPAIMLQPFKDHRNHCQIRSMIEHGHLNTLPFTGHSFIGLTDENGREERWGYTTKADVAGVIETIRGIEGNFVSENANQQYNEAIVYPISRDQYLAAKQKTEEYRQNPGTYKLFEKNCSTVARDILAAAKVDELPGKGAGLTPYGLAAKKRITLARRRCEAAVFKIKNAVRSMFGQKKAPRRELLDSLRTKPVPVPIKTAMRTARKDPMTPINVETVITNIARGR